MKLYLSVDMEGITGLADHTHVGSSKHNYERKEDNYDGRSKPCGDSRL